MITKPRFVTIDTDKFSDGQAAVFDAAEHQFLPGTTGGFNLRGDWEPDTLYQVNDVVTKDGSSYVCTLDHISASDGSGSGYESGVSSGYSGSGSGSGIDDEPGIGGDWETYWQLLVEKGNDGQDGADGTDGQGVPTGGTTGQILAKNSGTDYDTEWIDPPEGGSGGGTVDIRDVWLFA